MKKVLSLLLTLCMMLSALPMAALADDATEQELEIHHQFSQNGFTFDKLSHSTTGPETADGIVDYMGEGHLETFVPGVSEDGKGDSVQSYSYCGAAYGDWMYVGTMYGALSAYTQATRAIDIPGAPEGFAEAVVDAMFNGMLNKGREEDGVYMGGIFFKFNVKTGETKLLMSREMYENGECTGVPIFRSACEYNGKLYFVGIVSNGDALKDLTGGNAAMAMNYEIMMQIGVPCIYELDPTTDELVEIYRCVNNQDYLALMDYSFMSQKAVFTSTRAIGVFKDTLIAGGIQKGPVVHEGYAPGDAVLLASKDPSQGQESFKVIAHMEDLFNYPAIWRDGSSGGGGIYQVVEFNDKLYVAIVSGDKSTQDATTGQFRPFAIVRGEYDETKGDVDNADAWTWTPLVGDMENDGATYTFGIDPVRTASSACTMQVYGNHLYIGEYNDVNGSLTGILQRKQFNTLAANLAQSINLYRMDADENMEMVIGDPTEMFPESLSGAPSGYASHMSQYTWMTNVYDDVMYLSYMDESSLLRPIAAVASGEWMDMSEEEMQRQVDYLNVVLDMLKSMQGSTGGEVVSYALPRLDQYSLTAEQKTELRDALVNGKLLPALNTKSMEKLTKLAGLAGKLLSMWNEPLSLEFANTYIQFVDEAITLEDLPVLVQQIVDAMSDPEVQATMGDFVTCFNYMTESEAGFDLIAIKEYEDESVSIVPVTTNGFNDRYNHGLRIFVNTDDYMGVGTANPFLGTQIWRMSEAYDFVNFDVTVNGGEGSGRYAVGSEVTISANCAPNQKFLGWTVETGNVTLDDPTALVTTFTMPVGEVVISAAYEDVPVITQFEDVTPNDYYFEAVLWAAQNGITSGTSATTFSPDLECTRAQALTFLWRAMGSPVVGDVQVVFEDVSENDYFYAPMLWAVKNGITSGTSATTFSPNDTITRAQAAVFMWQAAKSAGWDVSSGEDNNILSFEDALLVPEYARAAFQWTCAEGIICGNDRNELMPLDGCTRAHLVTSLKAMMDGHADAQ